MLPPLVAARRHLMEKQDDQDGQEKRVYKELTRQIIGVCFEVIGELGDGFLERVYHSALPIALRDAGLQVQSDVPIDVSFRGQKVGVFRADLVVAEKVLVEVKAVRTLAPEHQAQVINYLKATGLKVGLLVNFGRSRLEIKRLHP